MLSTISDPVGANVDLNQILYMNGEHQYQSLDQVTQILNIPSIPTNTEFYSQEEYHNLEQTHSSPDVEIPPARVASRPTARKGNPLGQSAARRARRRPPTPPC